MGKKKRAYLDKSNLELQQLKDKLTSYDIKEIARKMEMHTATIYYYLNTSERYKDVKVPADLITIAQEVISKRKKKTMKLNETIKNI